MSVLLNTNCECRYICDLEENNGIIRWQYEKKDNIEYVLIVQTAFTSTNNISDIITTINKSNVILLLDKEITITSEISCKLTTVSQGNRGVYSVKVMPAKYAVYACKKENENLIIFEEENKNQNHCQVPAIIEYKIEDYPVVINEGRLFRKNEVKYNFSKITLFENKSYNEGVLYYTFEESEIQVPIRSSFLGKPFFVKWLNNTRPPLIRSDYCGFECRKR